MGFMDWVEPLWSSSYYTRKDRDENAAKYQGLLSEYGLDQMQVGPPEPGQPAQPALPQDFYARAAAIPGYQDLAPGMQTQQGAMDRQQQQQAWDKENISLAQKMKNDFNERQQAYLEKWDQFVHANPSAYEQGAMTNMAESRKLQQKGLDLQALDITDRVRAREITNNARGSAAALGLPDPEKGKVWTTGPGGVPFQMYAPGSEGERTAFKKRDDMLAGILAADEYSTLIGGPDGIGVSEFWNQGKKGQASSRFNEIITAKGAAANLGTMQPGDVERMSAGMADPSRPFANLFGATKASTIGNVAETKETLRNQLADFLEANPEASSPEAVAIVADILEARKKARAKLTSKGK
jgi:hypothetical protein